MPRGRNDAVHEDGEVEGPALPLLPRPGVRNEPCHAGGLIDSLHRFGVSDLDIAVKANFTVHVLPTGKSARLDDLRFLNRNGSDVTVISVK